MYGFKWINFIDTFVVCQALKVRLSRERLGTDLGLEG